MIDSTATRTRVTCTECEFSETVVRSDGEWLADGVADHAVRTGHRLRVVPTDG